MNESTALANLVLAVHAVIGVAVFGGLAVAIAGMLLGWQWTRSHWWRVPHLVVTVYLFLRSRYGLPCPFSVWEDSLRRAPLDLHDATPVQSVLRFLSFRNLDDPSFSRAMAAFALVTIALFVAQQIAVRSNAPATNNR